MDVTVQYFKYDGGVHWRHDLKMLGEDEHGLWLGGPQGTVVQRGREPPHSFHPFVQLIKPDRWWTLLFNGPHSRLCEVYVDVITPARWTAKDRVEMVDIDLDVVRYHDGSVEVLDEDELVDHARRLGYPPALVDRARVTAAQVVARLENAVEPFGVAGRRWLTEVQ